MQSKYQRVTIVYICSWWILDIHLLCIHDASATKFFVYGKVSAESDLNKNDSFAGTPHTV